MRQPSFFSVDARVPAVDDLAGLLCGPGQAVRFGRGGHARLSVVVDERWRADVLAAECADRGVEAVFARSEDGLPLVRTAFRADLVDLATRWTRGAVKSAPPCLELDGRALRLWALAAGRVDDHGYVLGLDTHAPDTYAPIVTALAAAGLTPALLGPRGGGPAVRVAGRKRLERLSELVGPPPAAADPAQWPSALCRRADEARAAGRAGDAVGARRRAQPVDGAEALF